MTKKRGRESELQALAAALERLMLALNTNPANPWTKRFQRCLDDVRKLQRGRPGHDELSELGAAITRWYEGPEDFAGYGFVPGDEGALNRKVLEAITDFDEVSDEVFERAERIRDR